MFAMIQLATIAFIATIGNDCLHDDTSCCKTFAFGIQLIALWPCVLLRMRITLTMHCETGLAHYAVGEHPRVLQTMMQRPQCSVPLLCELFRRIAECSNASVASIGQVGATLHVLPRSNHLSHPEL